MSVIISSLKKLDKFEKVLLVSGFIVLLGIVLVYCCYALFGGTLIEKMYHGQSFDFLNNLIKYQHKYPLEHYLSQGPLLVKRLLLLASSAYLIIAGFSFLLYRLIFSEKKPHLSIAISLPVMSVALLYYVNPGWRIFSIHGFYRTGIVYQILNGFVPPSDPLFADYMVQSPWGFAWLVAMVSKLFNISPFYSCSFINLSCLLLSCLGIYMVAGLLIRNQKAQIFSILIALFAVTPFPRSLLTMTQGFLHNHKTEWRATPVFTKFMTINGNPVGIAFFVFFLYSAIQLFKEEISLKHILILLVSFVGAGFFYAPVLPGMSVCLALLILLSLFRTSKSTKYSWKRPVFLSLVLIAGIIMLKPYFLTISSGVRSDIHFFNPVFVYKSTVNFLVALLPLLLIILVARKHLFFTVNKTGGMVLLTIIFSLISSFLFVHILDSAEYKFLGLAGISIGILGGIAFESLSKKIKATTLILLLLFLTPSLDHYWRYLFRVRNHPVASAIKRPGVYEKGTKLFIRNPEEAELYHWIRENTSVDQLFVDTTLRLPVFAERRLLTGIDHPDDKKEGGYSIDMHSLAFRSAYDKEEFYFRTQIVRNLYGFETSLDRKAVFDYLSQENILIILRKKNSTHSFNNDGLREVFKSSNGEYLVYSLRDS